MKLTVYTNESLFEELKMEWNTLLRHSANDRVFSTWEWKYHWWMAYQAGELFVITCRNDEGQLMGIAPWFIQTDENGERIVRGIGCVDVTDYVDVIVDATCLQPVYTEFARCLAENSSHYDRINLCNIPHNSPTHEQLPQILESMRFSTEVIQQEVCPTIHLPETWEGYLEQLDKKQRHELRRKLRRGEGHDVDWYSVDQSHDLNQQLELFLKLMAASAPDKAQFLENPKNHDFFMRVMPVIFEKGWLQLNFLTVGGEPAATYLNFDYNGRIMVYNSGLSMQHMEVSPGIVLLAFNIRHTIERSYREFDFLRGNEEYKYRMGAVDAPVYMLKAKQS